MRNKKLWVPLFNNRLRLYDVNSKGFKKIDKKYNVQISKAAGAFCFEKTIKGYPTVIIVINKKYYPKEDLAATIAHEAVHAVNFIFIMKGLIADRYNDEAQAYLTGWIVRECHKFFKHKRRNYEK
ncbi:hypothetical protein LCGC14_2257120 [marine sediment metagenome]|uniref:SprT-like domain-containing protein n=1 Tax=marine sediment metagenome TaxID=412755 RepID=A0A0F9FVX8_9ZZZZ